VKAALVDRLAADLPGRTPTSPWVAISDVLPDDGKRWPFVIVRTTKATGHIETGVYKQARWQYRCEVTCGARSTVSDRDGSHLDATAQRDDLLQAVRDVLRWRRKLADGMRIAGPELSEVTAPAVLDGQGPAIALGTITFDVHSLETTGPPSDAEPDVPVTDVDVDLSAHPHDTTTI
jgi:hypothetical protein